MLCPDISSFEVQGDLFTIKGLVLTVKQKPNLTPDQQEKAKKTDIYVIETSRSFNPAFYTDNGY